MTAHSAYAMPRIKLHYATAAGGHSLTANLSPGQTAGDASASAAALAGALKVFLTTAQSFSSCDYAPAGSGIFNPITFTAVVGTLNTATTDNDSRALCLTWVGRTLTGARARLFLFSDVATHDASYRVTSGESTLVAGVVTFLNGNQTACYARDGNPAIWKAYANATIHKRWVRKLRG